MMNGVFVEVRLIVIALALQGFERLPLPSGDDRRSPCDLPVTGEL